MWMDKFTISSLFINIYPTPSSHPPHFEIAEITVSLCSSSTRNSISRNLIDDIFPVLLSPCVGKGMTHFRGEGKSSGIHTALNSTRGRGGGGEGGGRPFRNFRNSGGDSVDGNRYSTHRTRKRISAFHVFLPTKREWWIYEAPPHREKQRRTIINVRAYRSLARVKCWKTRNKRAAVLTPLPNFARMQYSRLTPTTLSPTRF